MGEDEILKYDNVPVYIAAKYLDVSPQYIRIGLQQQRLPIGSAVKMSSQWSYHISPGLLVSYKTGKEYLKPLIDNIENILKSMLNKKKSQCCNTDSNTIKCM